VRLIVTSITGEAVTVATAAGLVEPPFADVALIVTVPPVGTVDGAAYVVTAPLAVLAGLKLPQLPAGLQLHKTPALFTSLATTAVSACVPDVAMSNADGDTETVIGRIVIVGVLATFVESPTEVAVSVTVQPWGTVVGAA
jgi:hypothetical protein